LALPAPPADRSLIVEDRSTAGVRDRTDRKPAWSVLGPQPTGEPWTTAGRSGHRTFYETAGRSTYNPRTSGGGDRRRGVRASPPPLVDDRPGSIGIAWANRAICYSWVRSSATCASSRASSTIRRALSDTGPSGKTSAHTDRTWSTEARPRCWMRKRTSSPSRRLAARTFRSTDRVAFHARSRRGATGAHVGALGIAGYGRVLLGSDQTATFFRPATAGACDEGDSLRPVRFA